MPGPQPALNPRVTAETFADELVAEFPDLAGAVEEWGDIGIHTLVDELLVLTNKSIQAGDLDLTRRCFRFAERVFISTDYDTWNAIAVSYLEHLDVSGPSGQSAKEILPTALLEGWRDLDLYMTQLVGDVWIEDKTRRGW